jgi:hypothetical protein
MLIFNRSCVGLAFCPLRTIAAPVSHTVPTSTVFTQHSFGDSTSSGLRASNLAIKFDSRYKQRIVSSRKLQRFWGPPTFQAEGYCGRRRPGVKLTTQIQAVLRIRMRGAKSPLHHTPSWNTQAQISHLICYKINFIRIVNGQHKYDVTPN